MSLPLLHWTEAGQACSALWRSERGAAPPKRVVLADDTTTADDAYHLACEGTALLWRGDFQNARQLLQALARRIDKTPQRKQRAAKGAAIHKAPVSPADGFNLHRQAQAQRARVLAMVLLPFNADYSIPLRRAPDARQACTEAWGPAAADGIASVASLRDLLGMTSAHEWRKKGVEIPALGAAPKNRIHPHYGVFSPVRGEYIDLVATTPLPKGDSLIAFDIGTGTGVLAAVLARRGVARVVATDQDPRALACARENLDQLGVADQVSLLQANLFPQGLASLVVCNPPWVPARPSSPIEYAVYDENSQMLRGFLNGLVAHLAPGGEGWLILSDLAEHLGLRSREELLAAFAAAGLRVLERRDAKPVHPKATDGTDALHAARAAEITSLWRLGPLH
ncbi:methyltransferase [Rhodoferax sp.]|uniref:methyltransferase n=1 Tax=Rhodoferax sp. TaxID=50421 RepID=UPI002ACD87CE|nr:methyltransferase [Rhodoferax sp.]MDZ7921112.1 methyltransferase [Rhodoferax sp.]